MFRLKINLMNALALSLLATQTSAQTAKSQPPSKSGSPLVTALWFSHIHASPKALAPGNDSHLKLKLIAALKGNDRALSFSDVNDVFEKSVFEKIAGADKKLTLEKMERMLQEKTPRSRDELLPPIRQHADLLTTQFDLIEERHRERVDDLVAWIVKKYDPTAPLGIIVICTGNSRRSMLGSTMGNIASAYYGLPNIRFFSGGTTPSAFNPRAIAALKAIGVEIEATGLEAPRGIADEENPIYSVRTGKRQQTTEFSKLYSNPKNPQEGFAAVLVCSEADASCPTVKGASARIPVPYMDPKAYDGAPFETAKYAERRDDIGRFMLNVLMQAKRRLEIDRKLK
jgi:arsenate reductase